jgi:Transcriptional regulators
MICPMDAIDRRIVAALLKDGRLSNVDLAATVGLSPSPCLRRVRALEESGVISGYAATLGREAVGLTLTVFVEVTVARHSRGNADRVATALAAIPGAVACHMVSGDADFLLELAVADLPAYERLLTERLLPLEDIERLRSNFSLRRVLSQGPLALP